MSLIHADARAIPLRDACVQCVVTSPPYWGLRDYGVAGQLGMQQTPERYVSELADVFDEVHRVLADDGTCWVNLGDSYQNAKGQAHGVDPKQPARRHGLRPQDVSVPGLKPKDLVGIPWMFAFECRRRGWYLRGDIIWSKPNPMPESVQDRPTKAHEYIFLLTKSARYYYDAAAIREPYAASTLREFQTAYTGQATKDYAASGVQNPSDLKRRITDKQRGHGRRHVGFNDRWDAMPKEMQQASGANKRSVWTVATMPFTGWVKTSRQVRVSWDESDGDTTRTTSPDCPVHGDRAVQAAMALCDAHGAGSLSRTARSGGGRAPAPLLDSVPTDQPPGDCYAGETTDSSHQSHGQPATRHSNRSRRTGRAPVTTAPCMPSAETDAGTADTSASRHSTVGDSHTLESSTPEPHGQAGSASVEIPGHTLGKCSCAYYRTVTEEMSHFATMPEKLVEPCILAGSRLGDRVFDPFIGSGTVGAVAERLGRRWVGTDLNPAYHELARKRTAQRGLRFEATA